MDIEKEFPALNLKINGKKMIYMDSACSVLKMKSAIEAEKNFLIKFGGCSGKRSAHILARAGYEEYLKARKFIARCLGAESDEIIFTSGTTEAVNILADSFKFPKNKNEVILSALEHNSVFLPFLRLSESGKIKLKIIPLKNYEPDFKAFKKTLSKKTALLCLTRAGNAFGSSVDVKKFIKAAHNKGAAVFIDEAQYIPTHKENLKKLGADFAAFSGHKMGAPFGIGVLFAKKEAYPLLSSSKPGGGTISKIDFEKGKYFAEYLEGNLSFEAGIQNYAGAAALAEAFKTLNKIGFGKIRSKMENLVDSAFKKLSGFNEIKIIGKRENLRKGAILPFASNDKNFSLEDFNIYLNNYSKKSFVAIRTGRHCADLAFINEGLKSLARLSFFIYNKPKDIDIFVSALKNYIKSLK